MIMRKTVKNILSFTKIEHTIFSLPLVITGAWFGMDGYFPAVPNISLIIIATIGARIFGMSFNRILDRKFDALNPRTSNREIPSGKMTLKNALFVASSGLCLYIVSCAALGGLCLLLSPIPLIFLLFYSFLKRFTFLCHFGIGFCLALAPLSAFIATSGHAKFTLPAMLFSVFVFCWLSGADIIYSMMDMESDLVTGIYSLPATIGVIRSQLVAAVFHILALMTIAIIIFLLSGGFLSWVLFFISSIFFSMMYIPSIPVTVRFFPLSSFAGIAGCIAPILT